MLSQRNWQTITLVTIPLVVVGLIGFETIRTAPIRASVATLTELIGAANRGDLDAARSRCSREFLRRGGPETAPEGGLVGLPRSINKSFRAWTDGPDVLICPTGRVGPIYRFVLEDGDRRFDGIAGVRGPSATITP